MAVAPLVSFALACLAGASCGDFPECAVFFTVLALAMARPTFFLVDWNCCDGGGGGVEI